MHPSLLTALLMRSGWALGGSNTNCSTFLVGAWSNLTTPGPRVGIRSQFDWLWLCMPFSWWGFMTKLGILSCDVFFGLPNCFGNWFSFAYLPLAQSALPQCERLKPTPGCRKRWLLASRFPMTPLAYKLLTSSTINGHCGQAFCWKKLVILRSFNLFLTCKVCRLHHVTASGSAF